MVFKCKDRILEIGKRTLVMGILNVTPDSFSDGGLHSTYEAAVKAAELMVSEGADVIDIGGESTRPGYTPVSIDEELSRIIPVIETVSSTMDVAISVDTLKPEVLDEALKAGAHIANDINGLIESPKMADIAAVHGAGIIAMFNKRLSLNSDVENIVDRAVLNLTESIRIAHLAGVSDEYLMTDPGVGFGTTREEDIELVKGLKRLSLDGKYPVLLAASRKRLAGLLAGRETLPQERDAVSTGIALAGISNGASMIRTHNVRMTVDAISGFEALRG